MIVADVGGTNGRFALATCEDGKTVLSEQKLFSDANLAGFEDLLALYLDHLDKTALTRACFATAGPNDGRKGMLTNRGWPLDASALEQRFGLDEVLFVNDFKALACMAPVLPESASIPVKDGSLPAPGPLTVMGPGTGLGVALVTELAGESITISTEGGHMAFAPVTPLEVALRDHLAQEFPHVYIELLLSGAGLARIHDFLVAETGTGKVGLSPPEITTAALAGDDAGCTNTVQLFLSVLGSVAGDYALCHGAVGGVFLGGGILPRIASLLPQSDFSERFCAKGIMKEYMSAIPVRLITQEHVALEGAARLFQQHQQYV